MKISESKSQARYQQYLLERIREKGWEVPLIMLGAVGIFTLIDYLVLELDSIGYRLLAILPLLASIMAHLYKASAKVLRNLQNTWLLGGNLMMAGLSFEVFTSRAEDVVLCYGTLIGYSIAIYISILISYDRNIRWIILGPLLLVSFGLYFSMIFLEWTLMLNLYVVVTISFILVNNQHKQEYTLFKQRLLTEELNLKLEQFGHMASHDLMSPLGSISANLGIIERRIAEQRYEKAVQIIPTMKNSVQHMADLLDGIWTYSREPELVEDHVWVDIEGLCEEVKENLTEQMAGIQVNFSIEQDLPKIFGSPTRIFQIFHNLLSNAIKYRDPNRPLALSIKHYVEGKEQVIAIQDNGLGIPEFMKERVFEPFERYHIQTSGKGLGLSMVRKHIEVHEGRIELESEEGVGSCFYLRFPEKITSKTKVLVAKEK